MKVVFYWIGGKIEVGEGSSVEDCFMNLGYSNGALAALDFYSKGSTIDYKYNKTTRSFVELSPYEKYKINNKRSNENEIIYRARCILGFRGIKNFETISINVSSLYNKYIIRNDELSEEQIIYAAKEIAYDTLYWL